MALTAPIPASSPLVETERDPTTGQQTPTGVIANAWYEYFHQAQDRLNAGPDTLATVFDAVTDQSAAIGTTTIPLPKLSAGLYRVTTYGRITRAASTSSSLTVTLGWTDGTVGCIHTGAAITGNTTTRNQSLSVMIRCDNATTITYSTAYASSGGTAMQYRLDIAVEELPT